MVAFQAHVDDTDCPRNQTIENALASLEQALRIVDEIGAPPHIGARLQEVIESLKDEIRSPGP